MRALDWLRARGLAVPGEVSVVGFDGVPEAAATDPPLTTVRQPIGEIGRRAVEIIIEQGEEVAARSPRRRPRGAGLDRAARVLGRARRLGGGEAEEREGQPHRHAVDEGEGGAAAPLAPEGGEERAVEGEASPRSRRRRRCARERGARLVAEREREAVRQEERQGRREDERRRGAGGGGDAAAPRCRRRRAPRWRACRGRRGSRGASRGTPGPARPRRAGGSAARREGQRRGSRQVSEKHGILLSMIAPGVHPCFTLVAQCPPRGRKAGAAGSEAGPGAAAVRRAFIGSTCAGPSMTSAASKAPHARRTKHDVFDSHQHQLDGRPADAEGHQQGHGQGPGRDLHRPQGLDRQGQQLDLVDRLDDELRRQLLQEARRVAHLRLGDGRRRPYRLRAGRRAPEADPGEGRPGRRRRHRLAGQAPGRGRRADRHDHLDRHLGAVQRHQPGQRRRRRQGRDGLGHP